MRFLLTFVCLGLLFAGACNDGDAPPNLNDASVNQDGGGTVDLRTND